MSRERRRAAGEDRIHACSLVGEVPLTKWSNDGSPHFRPVEQHGENPSTAELDGLQGDPAARDKYAKFRSFSVAGIVN
jgi:hypothetical protein